MSRIRFLPEVATDLEDAYTWYEQRQPGLGSRFAQAVEDCVQRVLERPTIYAVVDAGLEVRRGRIDRFPYSLVYLTEPSLVVVLAVTHQARQPGLWKERLENR